MSRRRAAVVGVAESDLGQTGRTALALQAQAVTRALADAGLPLAAVDGLATNGVGRFATAHTAEYLGLRPTWTDGTFAGGASYELFLASAVRAVEDGDAEVVVVCYGSAQRSARSRSLGGVTDDSTPEAQVERGYGPLNPVSLYALAAARWLHETGGTPEQLAEVAVAARAWALLNPAAFRHGAGPLTVDDVRSSPMVSSPLTVLDCCLVTDGGGAVVVTTLERARDLRRSPVLVLGSGQCTTSASFSQVPDLTWTGAAESGRRAFTTAGLTPADVDVVEVYDSFTVTVLLTLEALGFCARGEAGDFLADGRARPGGAFPLDTSGGGLSYCHPGMFGILLLVEAVRQLRGDCGVRQVPGAEVALAHGTGGVLSTHATVLLGRDR